MADELTLQLEPRALIGKKVARLRREGIVPGNVYGRGIESVAVQAPLVELRRIFRAVDRNAVVTTQIAGESETRPIVLRAVRRHPVSREVQHVDFYHIDMTRLIHSTATVHLVGAEQSEALALGGVLIHALDSVMLEALPADMPSDLTIDVSILAHFGQSIHVSDLVLPQGVRALTDPTAQLATIVAPRLPEEDEVTAGDEEAAAEGEPGEGEGGDAASADGAAPGDSDS